MIDDLCRVEEGCFESGDQIILIMDSNENITYPTFATHMTQVELVECISMQSQVMCLHTNEVTIPLMESSCLYCLVLKHVATYPLVK